MNNNIKQEINKIEIPEGLSERGKLGVTKAKLEMGKSKRKWPFILAPAMAIALALGIFAPSYFTNNPPENPVINTLNADYVIDTNNPRAVVGFSDNVFVGKVIKQVGTKSLSVYPETQFEVEVMDNIKGELIGTVKVNQAGGYEGENLFLMEDDKLLIEGKTYMFATRYLKEENWQTVIPVGGDIPVTSDEENKELIEKYQKAYKEEIPFD